MTNWNEEAIQSIYRDAWEVWGEDRQLNLITEEIGELLKAINKYRRGKGTPQEGELIKELIREAVDVIITVGQPIVVLNQIDFFRGYYHYKLDRLVEKLDEHKRRSK